MTPEQERALGVRMRRSQQGDQAAYDALLHDLAGLVARYVRRRVGEVPWADDVVQESLVAVHRARHSWNPERPFVPWFYAIVQSRLVDAIRRERRLARREVGSEAALARARSRSAAAAVQAARDLDGAVRQLAPVQRRVIELLKLEERTVREVAERLAISEGNVRVIAHRAMKALRLLLGGAGGRTT